jgi:bidirectional [NiFe] hydrogenase diaphorase subunit
MDLPELVEIAEKERRDRLPVEVRCCVAAGCVSAGSEAVLQRLQEQARQTGLSSQVKVCGVGCLRLCSQGPLVRVVSTESAEQRTLYQKVTTQSADSVLDAAAGRPRAEGSPAAETLDPSSPFFVLQASVILENSGVVEPERIESYIAHDGYQALAHVLHEMTPGQVVEEITRSGLRGRGGAGFPTGVKWATVAKSAVQRKYVVCNADEGDPGAFMNRSTLESDPHSVLEGMAIAGYAIGATQGYIYVRGEYPLAIQRLQIAIKQADGLGLLGSHVFSSPFDFRVDIRIGAGAFVCGEETALMASIMGERGTPRPRPPYPAEKGLWGHPTLINNVETFANVPRIIRKGADWFAAIGTQKSKGTKVFCLTGKVRHTGLVEVPLGTPLRRIVEDIGGGVPGGAVKAVQTGGPSGGCIPVEHLDTPVDYESLAKLGSIMGSGGMIVMDQHTDMVDVARFFMEFCVDESCGKCIPCRAGTVQMHHLLVKILEGRAGTEDLQLLETLCDMVKHTSLCGLGQTAPNPVLSTLRYFRNEYLSRLRLPDLQARRQTLPLVSPLPSGERGRR